MSVIGGVAGSSKQGRKAAWKFVKDNWEELYNRYQGGFLISRLVKVRKKLKLTESCEATGSVLRLQYVSCSGKMEIIDVLLCSVFTLMFLVLCLQLTVDGFAIDKMAAEVKVRT